MVSKSSTREFCRAALAERLTKRLAERRRFIQVVTGPRQTGKTTLVRQVLERIKASSLYASADEPSLRDTAWLTSQWDAARGKAAAGGRRGAVLVLDEVQKASGWSETVKRLWDEDTAAGRRLRVVLLGSAPLLLQRGMSESLAGRFEVIRVGHWSYAEMAEAFGFSLEQYLYFGGYPGAASLIRDPERWRHYILDSLVETTLSRDVLLLSRVDKPALLRRLFDLSCGYSGQMLSYTKMLGQLQDAGNTTTLAHYLDLLAGAGLVAGLPKYAGSKARQRGSSPKLQVLNTALMTALSGLTPSQAKGDRDFRGRLIESAVGAHLLNTASADGAQVSYWREGALEVDFVLRHGKRLTAIEVKSGRARSAAHGLEAFSRAFKPDRVLMVGGDGIPLADFLAHTAKHWA